MTERTPELPIEDIKAKLRTKVDQIPFSIWLEWFPNTLRISLTEMGESNLLPSERSLVDRDGKRRPLGHDVLGTSLARNGKILVELVHYEADDFSGKERCPREVLGEADEETYRRDYDIALAKLAIISRDLKEAELA